MTPLNSPQFQVALRQAGFAMLYALIAAVGALVVAALTGTELESYVLPGLLALLAGAAAAAKRAQEGYSDGVRAIRGVFSTADVPITIQQLEHEAESHQDQLNYEDGMLLVDSSQYERICADAVNHREHIALAQLRYQRESERQAKAHFAAERRVTEPEQQNPSVFVGSGESNEE